MGSRSQIHSSAADIHRANIEQLFYDKLMKMPYQDISISILCDELGISRKIFYRYYESKMDCLCCILYRCVRQIMADLAKLSAKWELDYQFCVDALQYVKRNRDFFDMIARNGFTALYAKNLIYFFYTEDEATRLALNSGDVVCDLDILCSYFSANLTFLFGWQARGFDTPVEDMAKKYYRLLRYPLVG